MNWHIARRAVLDYYNIRWETNLKIEPYRNYWINRTLMVALKIFDKNKRKWVVIGRGKTRRGAWLNAWWRLKEDAEDY
jgi:hypothetical protein